MNVNQAKSVSYLHYEWVQWHRLWEELKLKHLKCMGFPDLVPACLRSLTEKLPLRWGHWYILTRTPSLSLSAKHMLSHGSWFSTSPRRPLPAWSHIN